MQAAAAVLDLPVPTAQAEGEEDTLKQVQTAARLSLEGAAPPSPAGSCKEGREGLARSVLSATQPNTEAAGEAASIRTAISSFRAGRATGAVVAAGAAAELTRAAWKTPAAQVALSGHS